jgi:ATP-dependent DNA helicase RecG
MGYGIHKMYREQRKRFFPLPQYDLSDPRAVSLTIYGHSIDEKYSKLLLTNTSLPLSTIILLDRFQKGLRIPDKELQYLKKEGLIAGRKPNYYLAEKMAVKTGDMGAYIKNRGFDKAWYQNLILEFIRKKGEASKAELKDLLWDKLSDVLSETQKVNKINNLIQELRREEKIENKGTFADPRWKICR